MKRVITLIIGFLLSTSVFGANVYTKSSPKGGLIGYWNMDTNDVNGTTIYDKSGNGINLGIVGSYTSADGKIGEAATVSDSDGRMIAEGLEITAGNPLTVSIWLKPDSVNSDGDGFFASQTGGGGTSWQISDDGSNGYNVIGENFTTVNFANSGDWDNIVVTYDGVNDLNVYVNGSLENNQTTSGHLSIENNPRIGINRSINAVGEGDYDEVRLYNRELSSSEATNLYNATKISYVKSAPRSGLVGYWNMDSNDINGTTLYEKSGKGYNGTLVNAPVTDTGIVRECLTFDTASNQHVTLSNDIGSEITATNALTFATWVKLDSFASNAGIIGLGETGDRSLWLFTATIDNKIHAISNTDGSNGSATLTNLLTDTWYFLVVRGDTSSSTFKSEIYNENGTLIDSTTDTGYTGNINSTTSCSLALITAFNDLDGCMDETRLYNRYLSDSEISNLLENKYIVNLNN